MIFGNKTKTWLFLVLFHNCNPPILLQPKAAMFEQCHWSFQNNKIEIIIINGLNHYLTNEDLSPDSMYNIDIEAKRTITDWILKQ